MNSELGHSLNTGWTPNNPYQPDVQFVTGILLISVYKRNQYCLALAAHQRSKRTSTIWTCVLKRLLQAANTCSTQKNSAKPPKTDSAL